MNTLIEFERNEYEDICIEMRVLLREEKELAKKKEALRSRIIEMSGGDRMEYGIKVQFRTAKGGVDYAKLIKDCKIEPSTLEFFRKDDREYYEVRSY